MEEPNPLVSGKLAVVEEEEAFLVIQADDPDDWLARFEKSPGFPAREWAQNMVQVYNRRLSKRSTEPPTPPGQRPVSYQPVARDAGRE